MKTVDYIIGINGKTIIFEIEGNKEKLHINIYAYLSRNLKSE